MILENAMIFQGEQGFVPGAVRIEGGRFEAVGEVERGASREAPSCIDLQGAFMIPGLIDIHIRQTKEEFKQILYIILR